MSQFVFLNEEFVPEENAVLHIRDLSIQRGYGVFDFLKVVNGVPVYLDDHLSRFYSSAEAMHLPLRYSKQELKEIISQLILKNAVADTGIRITLTGGYSDDGFWLSKPNLAISLRSFTPPTEEQFEKGIKLITYPHQRQLPHVKSIDYLMGIWLQPLIKENKADDVLYHWNETLTESPRSNFFIVTQDHRIITPSKNILKGVIRAKLIQAAEKKFIVEEREVNLHEIKTAKEAFLTSTTKLLLPIRQIDGHVFTQGHSVSSQLYLALHQLQTSAIQMV